MSARYFYTTPEVALIKQHYPVGGIEACLKLLPGRSRGSIQQKAAGLKIRSAIEEKRGTPRHRHATDLFTDKAIREVYEAKPVKNAINELAARLGKPRWWVSKRAEALDLKTPRFKEPVWSDKEVELLEDHMHKPVATIKRILESKGFTRSTTAISVRRKRLGLGLTASRQRAGIYSANQFAKLMGVDGKTVTRWINLGMLKTTRRGTERVDLQGGDMHEVTADEIRRFIVVNPESVDLRKVDKHWFIEVLGKAAA